MVFMIHFLLISVFPIYLPLIFCVLSSPGKRDEYAIEMVESMYSETRLAWVQILVQPPMSRVTLHHSLKLSVSLFLIY